VEQRTLFTETLVQICCKGTIRTKPSLLHIRHQFLQSNLSIYRHVVAWFTKSGWRDSKIKLRVAPWSRNARTLIWRSFAVWRSTHAVARNMQSARGTFTRTIWTCATMVLSVTEGVLATGCVSESPVPGAWLTIFLVVSPLSGRNNEWCVRRQCTHRDLGHFGVKWLDRRQLKQTRFSLARVLRYSTDNDRNFSYFAKLCEPAQLTQFWIEFWTLLTKERPLFRELSAMPLGTPAKSQSPRIWPLRNVSSSWYEGYSLVLPCFWFHFARVFELSFSVIINTEIGSQELTWYPSFDNVASAMNTESHSFFKSFAVSNFSFGRLKVCID